MTLVDTSPLVALFDPGDAEYGRCGTVLKTLQAPLLTTVPVLTEAFHMLDPGSRGSEALRAFVGRGGTRSSGATGPATSHATTNATSPAGMRAGV